MALATDRTVADTRAKAQFLICLCVTAEAVLFHPFLCDFSSAVCPIGGRDFCALICAQFERAA
jgi:hypothetical protein